MKNKLLIVIFMLFICIGGLGALFNGIDVLYSERRVLEEYPGFIENGHFNDDFFDEADKYYSDHFLYRDLFRKAKGFVISDLLMIKEYNDIFSYDGFLFKREKIDESAIRHNLQIINELKKDFQNSYLAIIPSKNEYLTSGFDMQTYDEIKKIIEDNSDIAYIDLKELLSLDDYYRTDIHWRQDKIEDIAKYLCQSLGVDYIDTEYEIKEYYPFYGSLYANISGLIKADTLFYLDSDLFADLEIYSLEDGIISMYETKELTSPDAYSLFLGGPEAYIKIVNNNIKSDDKLIVFRDSYASSLLPLLSLSFKEIDIIDLRYYNRELLSELDLDEKAVTLFIYGTEVFNSYAIR